MWSPKSVNKIFSQKHKVFQDIFSRENIPTPEQLQESDSTCNAIKILSTLQFKWNRIFVK